MIPWGLSLFLSLFHAMHSQPRVSIFVGGFFLCQNSWILFVCSLFYFVLFFFNPKRKNPSTLDRCGLTASEMSNILQWVQLDAEGAMPIALKQWKAKPTSEAEQRGVWNPSNKCSEHWPGETNTDRHLSPPRLLEPVVDKMDVIKRQILNILKTQCPSFARLNSLPSDMLCYLLI